jgi:nucleotide-binding universal stress UspA family protein
MKILLPIDDSACSEAAVRAVIKQFRPKSEVRIVFVDEWPKGLPTSPAIARGSVAEGSVLYTHEEARLRGQGLLDAVAQRLTEASFQATTEIRRGDARREILDCAAEWKPDVIIVASHERRGLDRILLGSVAEGVLAGASCSVEIVRVGGDALTSPPAAMPAGR